LHEIAGSGVGTPRFLVVERLMGRREKNLSAAEKRIL
jgi:hypothetical protein